MADKFVLDRDTMNELEDFSARFGQLRNFIDFIHDFVWQEIAEGHEGETVEKLGCLTEMLSDVAHIRDDDLEQVIKKIAPLHNPAEG